MNMGIMTRLGIWIASGLVGLASMVSPHSIILGANTKISALNSYTTPLSADVLPINDTANAATKQITVNNLFSYPTATFPLLKSSTAVYSLGYGTTTNNIWSGQQSFWASTTLQNFTAQGASTTSLYVSGLASSTDLRVANVASTTSLKANVATIGALTVTSCSGCSSASGGVTIYTATTTSGRVLEKTLSLVSGDVVLVTAGTVDGSVGFGTMRYRISAGPCNCASTTIAALGNTTGSMPSSFTWPFIATTTTTVTFEYLPPSQNSSLILVQQNSGFANQF